jgi:hypothetical protein
MNFLVNGLNYNKPWGVNYEFDPNVVTKSVNPHWDLIKHATEPLHMPVFETLTNDELNSIRLSFLILDYTWESADIGHLYHSIHMECMAYNVPESRVILLTANLDREQYTYNEWHKTSGFDKRIATFSATPFVDLNHMFINKIPHDPINVSNSFITFSRNPRAHRTAMNYLIVENKLNAVMSQSAMAPSTLKTQLSMFNIDCRNETVFKTAHEIDRSDFDTDMPVYWTEDICLSAINYSFVLVQETILDDIGFYMTEKTFKYMLFNRPLIIWGQPGANHYLKDLGFNLYDNYFDLSFDFIKDDTQRLHAIVSELKRVDTMLSTIQNPYDWIYKDATVLQHNRATTLDRSVNKPFVSAIHNYMKSVI